MNATFYRLPSEHTVEHWVQQTGEGFLFAVKASRYITHVKRLLDPEEGIAHFFERLRPLADAGRLGPVLWQLPEGFRRDDDRLADALAALPDGRHAFEFRHESWFDPGVYSLLREHHASLVIADHPERQFQTMELTADWRYLRLHYGRRGRNGNYSSAELDEWAQRLRGWSETQECFVYFNNDWEAFAPSDAAYLARSLAAAAG